MALSLASAVGRPGGVSLGRVLTLDRSTWLQVLAEAWRAYPLEGCGLLLGRDAASEIEHFVPVTNAAASSRIFQLDPMGHMKAERLADDLGLQVVGVMHSHTHTAAYPSPTDEAEATKPLVPDWWHWLIVSLAWGLPESRSFRVAGDDCDESLRSGGMSEEPIRLKD